MDFGESTSMSPGRISSVINCFSNSSYKKSEQSFLNINIKDEPLDITECSLNELGIKNELDLDLWAPTKHESFASGDSINIPNIIEKTNTVNTSGILDNNEFNSASIGGAPITRKLVINGQAKTCIVVNNPELKQSIMESVEKARKTAITTPSSNKPSSNQNTSSPIVTSLNKKSLNKSTPNPMVKCSRCSSEVHIDNFRQHIDGCPPRKTTFRRYDSKGNHVVRVMYNPFTKEVVTWSDNRTKSSCQSLSANKNSVNNFEIGNFQHQNSQQLKSRYLPANNSANVQSLQPKTDHPSTESNFANSQGARVFSQSLLAQNDNYSDNSNSQAQSRNIRNSLNTLLNNKPNLKDVEDRVLSTFFYPEQDSYENDTKPDVISLKNCLPHFRCIRCDFSSKSLVIMKTHVKNRHFNTSENKKVPDTQNVNAASKICPQENLVSNSKSPQKVTLIPVRESDINEAGDDAAVVSVSRHIVQSADQSRSCHEEKNTNCENSNSNDKSTQNLSFLEPTTEFRGFDRDILEEKVANEVKKLTVAVKAACENLLRRSNHFNCSEMTKTTGDLDMAAYSVSPVRTSSKSVWPKKIAEKVDDVLDSPRRNMRLRSKSSSANKLENDKSTAPEFSPRRTRSRSICREKSMPEEKSEEFKRAQSMPRGLHKAENITSRRNDNNEICDSSENLADAKLETNSALRRESKLDLLKSSSKSAHTRGLNSLAVDTNSIKYKDREELKKATHDSNGIFIMSGNSNSESVLDGLKLPCVDKNSQTSQNLEDPLDGLLLKDNTFSCSVCSFTTEKKRVLNDHERHHRKTNLPIFRCIYCSQQYTRYMLYLHIQNVHPGQKFQIRDEDPSTVNHRRLLRCSMCRFLSNEQEKLRLHMKNHISKTVNATEKLSDLDKVKPLKSFRCSSCPYLTTGQEMLQLHVKKHLFEPVKRINPTGGQMYDCKQCSYGSSYLSDAKRHINVHKKNLPVKKCLRCNFKSTPKALECHMHKCKIKSKSSNKGATRGIFSASESNEVKRKKHFKCFTCLFTTSEQIKLKLHMKKHLFEPVKRTNRTGGQIYDCRQCSYSSSRLNLIKTHINAHRKNLPIKKCFRCNFKSTPRALECHVRKCKIKSKSASKGTTGSISSKVKTSEKGSTKTSELKEVTPKRSVKCSASLFTTSEQIKLKIHRNKHLLEPIKRTNSSGRIIYGCGMCSYECLKSVDIPGHINSHKNNMPNLKCPNCNFNSTSRALKYHMKKCRIDLKSASRRNTKSMPNKIKIGQRNSVTVQTKPKSLFQCTKCTFFTSLRIKLKLHIRKSHLKPQNVIKSGPGVSAQVLKCSRCSFSTNLRIKLKLHGKKCPANAETEKKFKCTYCSFVTAIKHCYKLHMESHARNLPIKKCFHCNFESTVPVLRKHMLNCGRNKNSPVGVKKSPVVSSGSSKKVYNCKLCSFTTSICQGYSSHMKIHRTKVASKEGKIKTNETPNSDTKNPIFHCSLCSFSTCLRIKLNIHMKKYHQKFSSDYFTKSGNHYQCNYCSYATANTSTLQTHIEMHMKCKLPISKCDKCDFRSPPHPLKLHAWNCKGKLVEEKITPSKKDVSTKLMSKDRTRSIKSSRDSPMIENIQTLSQNKSKNFSVPHMKDLSHKISKTLKNNENQSTNQATNSEEVRSDRDSYTESSLNQSPIKTISNKEGSDSINGRIKTDLNKTPVSDSTTAKFFLTSSGTYACVSCSYTTRKKSHMTRHVASHEKRNLLLTECLNCGDKFTSVALSFHTLGCNNATRQNKNGEAKSSRGGLDVPPQKTTQKVLFKCSECLYSSHSPSLIHDHKEKDHSEDKVTKRASPKSFKCEYCSFTSFWTYLLERHMLSHTILKLPVDQCGKCDFRSTPATLTAHTHLCTGKARENGPPKKKLKLSKNNPSSRKIDKPDMVGQKESREMKGLNELKISAFKSPKKSLKGEAVLTATNLNDLDIPKIKGGTSSSGVSSNNASSVHEKESTDLNTSVSVLDQNNPSKIVFSCPWCPFSTHLRIKLKFHLKKNHLKPKSDRVVPLLSSNEQLRKCQYCSHVSNKHIIKHHDLTHTVGKMPISKCSKCDRKL